MAKYLFVYHGSGQPDTQEAMDAAMTACGDWLGGTGSAVIDGGNPVSGYSLIEANDLNDACAKAQGCPILADGGSVEVAETFDI